MREVVIASAFILGAIFVGGLINYFDPEAKWEKMLRSMPHLITLEEDTETVH